MPKLTDAAARRLVDSLVTSVQKTRSISRENSGLSDSELELIHPWLFGKKCVLPTLLKMQRDINGSGVVEGLTLYNMVNLMRRTNPAVLLTVEMPRQPIDGGDPEWVGQIFYGPTAKHG